MLTTNAAQYFTAFLAAIYSPDIRRPLRSTKVAHYHSHPLTVALLRTNSDSQLY